MAVEIKTTLTAGTTDCTLLIENTTGYLDAVNNPGGFLITGDTPAALKEYMLDNVFFFTYVVKNNYDGTFTNKAVSGNVGKQVVYTNTKTFQELMDDELINFTYTFTEDGYYSVYQFAIPTEATKSNVESVATYTYYVKADGTVWVHHGADPDVAVDVFTLLTEGTTWNSNNIVLLKTELVSQCFLNVCFSGILTEFAKDYTDPACIKDSVALKALKDKRDLLFAVTNTVQYYTELLQYYKAAKLINDVSFCNICQEFVVSLPNCNCN